MTDDKQPPIRTGQPLPYPADALPPLDDAAEPAQPASVSTVECPTCHGSGRVVPVKITTHASLNVAYHETEATPGGTQTVRAQLTTIRRPPLTIEDDADTDAGQQPCPGYIPTSKTCERCGRAPSEHSHREDGQ